MKKKDRVLIGMICLVVTGMFAFGGPAAHKPRAFQVGPTSTVIVPAMRPPSADPFKTNTAYSVGDYIKVVPDAALGQPDYYWCITAGTSTNSVPTWTKTNDVTSGTAVFACVDRSRQKVYIQNWGTNSTVYLGFDWPAEYQKGGGLSISGGSFSQDLTAYQGEITAISGSGVTNLVTTQTLLQ